MSNSATPPLVTIVTPLYNGERYIKATVESILAQDYANIEYIVVNDGSTDSGREIAMAYGDRLRIIDQANAGQSAALNRGWSEARGKYITYVSADDLIHPECISLLVAHLEADAGAVCAYPNYDLISAESNVITPHVGRRFSFEALVVEQDCYIGPAPLFRKSAFEAVGGWDVRLKLAPDREFWMQISNLGTFVFEPRVLASYRTHPGSMSVSAISEQNSLEYIYALDKFYAKGSINAETAARRDEAYSRAYFVVARHRLKENDFGKGFKYLQKSVSAWPGIISVSSFVALTKAILPLRKWQSALYQLLGQRHEK